MNKIFFGLKRAYHGTLRVTRRALARMGLTAARFDMLYIIETAGGEMPRRELQRALGVAGSTVSRMLLSLEKLGLLVREIMLEDHRRVWVELTGLGRQSVREAAHFLIASGPTQLAVDSALCPDRWHDATACLVAQAACDRILRRFRRAYGDLATLHYPLVLEYVPMSPDQVWAAMVARNKRRPR
jgi:DNA-binding MarR family transcriptional regulator